MDNPMSREWKREMSSGRFKEEDLRGKLGMHRRFVGVRKDAEDILRWSKEI